MLKTCNAESVCPDGHNSKTGLAVLKKYKSAIQLYVQSSLNLHTRHRIGSGSARGVEGAR